MMWWTTSGYEPLPMATPNIRPSLRTYRRHVYIAGGLLLVFVGLLIIYYHMGTADTDVVQLPGYQSVPENDKLRWNYYRPNIAYRDLVPDRRSEAGKTKEEAPSEKMIILEGLYTPEDWSANPGLYTVAVEQKKNHTAEEMMKILDCSRMLECLNLTNLRNLTDPPSMIPDDVYWLSVMRDLHFEYRAIPFLVSGTLLGWRRECSVIPHTTDMDMATFEDEFPMALVNDSINIHGKPLKLSRILGRPGDSYEATFSLDTERGTTVNIDLFTMYRDPSMRRYYITMVYKVYKPAFYVFKQLSHLQKFQSTYPWFGADLCTADLHGHLFHVPCNPELILEADYGKNWRVDQSNKDYTWGSNTIKSGQIPAAEARAFHRSF
ncbi:unnamed protein product, partial [Mesorhabditis spiculigera]